MKINKFLLVLFIFFSTSVFAHKIPGIKLEVQDLKDNTMLITAKFKKSNRALIGNKIKLISMIDNRVLFEDKLPSGGLKTIIPNESYWVYLIVRDNDVVIDGPAPLNGFEKSIKREPKAFLYTLVLSISFLVLSILLMIKKKKYTKKESY